MSNDVYKILISALFLVFIYFITNTKVYGMTATGSLAITAQVVITCDVDSVLIRLNNGQTAKDCKTVKPDDYVKTTINGDQKEIYY
jgi:hypothetical protein